MSKTLWIAVMLAASFPGAALTGAPVDLTAVEGCIASLTAQVKSYVAVIEMSSDKAQIHGMGILECLKKEGGPLMYRMELVNRDAQGKTQKSLGVFDGSDLYSQTDLMGQPMVVKMKPDLMSGAMCAGGSAMFEQLHKNCDVKLLPEETIEGKAAYAIEATPKAGSDTTEKLAGKMVLYFSKETGIQIKEITFGKSGECLMTILYKDIKLDAGLKPEHFVYAPPAGAKVITPEDLKKESPNKPRPRPPAKGKEKQ
jgi:outer membrane lipoprotein-sorting protein